MKTVKHPKQINNKAAVLIPIVNVDNQLHLLFQIRSHKLKWQPGDICFPGGKIEMEDINPEQTAKRETCEELGLSSNEITILGQLPKFIATLGMIIYPFVGKIDSIDNLKLNFDEVESIFTVPLEWFKKINLYMLQCKLGINQIMIFLITYYPIAQKTGKKDLNI
ncbi:NUDIX hydrolase [Gilliamella apicola]|uniref:NUDIX hydrolase n=1 Tax=Gilliamella apicola TaxID=1196095 RepID=UPI00130DBB78|nr:CoA pyrophosphatase [Gilliamella apicola]